MSKRPFDKDDPAVDAIGADAMAVCEARLARVAGTHALMLDGIPMAIPPAVTGIGCWTALRSGSEGQPWNGSLRAAVDALPFADQSFCAVLVRFTQLTCIRPETVAAELARVLAPHGVLLVADLHPRSLWHAGTAPGRWERALRANGRKVPDDVGVVGFDDSHAARLTDPQLTTVRQPIEEMGRSLARLLLTQLRDPAKRPASLIVPTELVVRGSS